MSDWPEYVGACAMRVEVDVAVTEVPTVDAAEELRKRMLGAPVLVHPRDGFGGVNGTITRVILATDANPQ